MKNILFSIPPAALFLLVVSGCAIEDLTAPPVTSIDCTTQADGCEDPAENPAKPGTDKGPKPGEQQGNSGQVVDKAVFKINQTCPDKAIEAEEYTCDVSLPAEGFSYALLNKPVGMTMDGRGHITWIPSKDNKSNELFDLQVTKNATGEKAEQRFGVAVSWLNDPPKIVKSPPDTISVYAGAKILLPYEIEDPEEDLLLYKLTRAPKGASVDKTGVITFAPPSSLAGERPPFEIEISDGAHTLTHNFVAIVLDPKEKMVTVSGPSGPFLIDPFEATITDLIGCQERSYFGTRRSDDNYPEGFPDDVSDASEEKPLYACSKGGEKPSRNLTYLQAKRACQNVGKRLCTAGELKAACGALEAAKCAVNKLDADLNGKNVNCKPDAAVQIYDLLGNVAEWTSTSACDDGSCKPGEKYFLFGGSYRNLGTDVTCDRKDAQASMQITENAGFRCCMD